MLCIGGKGAEVEGEGDEVLKGLAGLCAKVSWVNDVCIAGQTVELTCYQRARQR
jgi:hypothetical protein